MGSRWNEKQAKKEEFEMNKMLDNGGSNVDFAASDVRAAAMGHGDVELFEKKLSKEEEKKLKKEKQALAKLKRDAKKKVCAQSWF
jgi:hypothetical protein